MKVEFDKIYYLTQYADYLSDEGVLEMFQEHVDNMDEGTAEQYLSDLYTISQELMPDIHDSINSKVYGVLTFGENLEEIVELLEAIKEADINKIDEMTAHAIDSYIVDNSIFSPDTWAEIADDELKSKGIDAYCLYWVKEIDYDCEYLQLNGYENGFNEMDKEDIIAEVLEELDFKDFVN